MKLRSNVLFGVFSFALTTLPLLADTKANDMVVHEWGTFTSLQDENGKAIGGINTDDEPVPRFVHRVSNFLLLPAVSNPFAKGTPHCHPDVTMRLETPVLYFHPSAANPVLQDVTVTATFHGGWLTEFYPDADAEAPGIVKNSSIFGHLRSDTTGTLGWPHLQVGGDWTGPVTSDHVWTSPRAVKAAPVRASNGEAEKFLFYRGVAHLDSPIAVVQNGSLELRSQCPTEVGRDLRVNGLWLVDIAANGSVAFKTLPPVTLNGGDKVLAKVSADFHAEDYSAANREKLRTALHDALVGEGLFGDEAEALLNTWEVSYFKSAGERLFFLVPRAWTDFYLPLKISTPSQITRVMVGRVELVSATQRRLLQQIAQTPGTELTTGAIMAATSPNATASSRSTAAAKAYQAYLDLGRFRNALVLEQQKTHPTAGLAAFILANRLKGYDPDGEKINTPEKPLADNRR